MRLLNQLILATSLLASVAAATPSLEDKAAQAFHQARFHTPGQSFEESSDNYLEAQYAFYQRHLEPLVEKAEFSPQELKRLRAYIQSGTIVLTNSNFSCCDVSGGGYSNKGIPLYESITEAPYHTSPVVTFEIIPHRRKIPYTTTHYVGHPLIFIEDQHRAPHLASRLIHETQHLLDQDENLTLVEREYRARSREAFFWSNHNWQGFQDSMAYVKHGGGVVMFSDLYNSTASIETFFKTHTPLYGHFDGWGLTPETNQNKAPKPIFQ